MSFLKKLGLAILKGVGIAVGYVPFITAQIPVGTGIKVFDTILGVAKLVVDAEVMIGAISDPSAKTGQQKLAAATPLVAQLIHQSELIAGHDIGDENLFLDGCKDIASGVAKVLNSRKA